MTIADSRKLTRLGMVFFFAGSLVCTANTTDSAPPLTVLDADGARGPVPRPRNTRSVRRATDPTAGRGFPQTPEFPPNLEIRQTRKASNSAAAKSRIAPVSAVTTRRRRRPPTSLRQRQAAPGNSPGPAAANATSPRSQCQPSRIFRLLCFPIPGRRRPRSPRQPVPEPRTRRR